jgi:hypothetical protein
VAAAAAIKKTPQRADREKEGGETTPLEKAASLVRVVRQVGSQTHINSMQLRTLLCRPMAVVGCRFRTGASTTFSIPFSPSLTRFPHVSFTATDILLSSLLPCFTGFTNYSCRTKREDDGAAGAMERVEEEEAVEVEAEAVGPAAGVEAARQEPREVRHLRPSRTQQTNCTTVPLTASGGHFVPLRWNQLIERCGRAGGRGDKDSSRSDSDGKKQKSKPKQKQKPKPKTKPTEVETEAQAEDSGPDSSTRTTYDVDAAAAAVRFHDAPGAKGLAPH